jgi:hypothetical protein
MSHRFNGGRGGAACDWCAALLVDGERVMKSHRVMSTPGGQRHYCGAGCMESHAIETVGMHRALVVALAAEAARLRMIEIVSADAAGNAAALDVMRRLLVSAKGGA